MPSLLADETDLGVRAVAKRFVRRAAAAAQPGLLRAQHGAARAAADLQASGHLERPVPPSERFGGLGRRLAARLEPGGDVARVAPGFVLGSAAAAQRRAESRRL